MFPLKIRTVKNIISRAEIEGRVDLKGSTARPKKLTLRVERKIIKTVYDRQSAIQYEKISFSSGKSCVSHEIIRYVLEKHKYVMLYYHDGSQRFWRKPLTALENKNLFPTVKFGKGLYIQQGSWCNQDFG